MKGNKSMKRFIEAGAKLVFLLALGIAAPLAFAQDIAPDVLVRTILGDVIGAIKWDKDIQSGDPRKIAPIVEAMILPHFDFAHVTRIAMRGNWRQATPAQQEQLTEQFKVLLVRTIPPRSPTIAIKASSSSPCASDTRSAGSSFAPRSVSRGRLPCPSTTRWKKLRHRWPDRAAQEEESPERRKAGVDLMQ